MKHVKTLSLMTPDLAEECPHTIRFIIENLPGTLVDLLDVIWLHVKQLVIEPNMQGE